ncbi:MAG TPA: PQQ-binding-like beta-propeller repeat protein [Gemmataceae bacterium]|nr:PQQ-binding-like beta-propeller repeat protein [Gemmataceae bacterium]
MTRRLSAFHRTTPAARRPRLACEALEGRDVPSAAWPTYGQNLAHTAVSPYVGAQTGQADWVAGINGTHAARGIAIGTDGLYYAGDPGLAAVNFDGSLRWSFPVGISQLTPAVGADGTVYVAGDSSGVVYAVNPGLPGATVDAARKLVNGVKWTFQAGTQGVQASPAIAPDGTVYVAALDSYLYALRADGTLKWRYKTGALIESSPAVGADGTVYFGSDDSYLYAVRPDGTLKWRYKSSDAINGDPTVGPNGTVYFTNANWNLFAVDPNGRLKWKAGLGKLSGWSWCSSSPALSPDGRTVYVGGGDGLNAFTDAGVRKWKYATGQRIAALPAVGADGTVYAHSYDTAGGTLHAVTPNGTRKWDAQVGSYYYADPVIGADGTVYVGGSGLHAFKDGAAARPVISWLRTTPDPVVVGGSLTLSPQYVRDVAGGSVSAVRFYQDADADGALNPAVDPLIGEDLDGSNGWRHVMSAPLTPGAYTYFAQAVDGDGNPSNVVSATSAVTAAPLTAAGGPAAGGPVAPLTETQLRPIAAEAVRRWNRAGLTAGERGLLRTVRFNVGDLDGATLGQAAGTTVTLDRDAVGFGWFVDPTPRSDAEFHQAGDQGEQGKMDLLTAVVHELGHVLGRDHEVYGVMAEALTPGTRETPGPERPAGPAVKAIPAAPPGWFLARGRR